MKNKQITIGWVIKSRFEFISEGKKITTRPQLVLKTLYNSFQTACEAFYYLKQPLSTIHKVVLSDKKTQYAVLRHKVTGEFKLDRWYYANLESKNIIHLNEALKHWKYYEPVYVDIL